MNWNRKRAQYHRETRSERQHELLVNSFLNSKQRAHTRPAQPAAIQQPSRATPAEIVAAIEANRDNPEPPWDVDPDYKPISRWPR